MCTKIKLSVDWTTGIMPTLPHNRYVTMVSNQNISTYVARDLSQD